MLWTAEQQQQQHEWHAAPGAAAAVVTQCSLAQCSLAHLLLLGSIKCAAVLSTATWLCWPGCTGCVLDWRLGVWCGGSCCSALSRADDQTYWLPMVGWWAVLSNAHVPAHCCVFSTHSSSSGSSAAGDSCSNGKIVRLREKSALVNWRACTTWKG